MKIFWDMKNKYFSPRNKKNPKRARKSDKEDMEEREPATKH